MAFRKTTTGAFAFGFVLLWAQLVSSATNASVNALSIAPSGVFDGNDGKWSSFEVQVGTPGQTTRLLPGTSASAGDLIWVVLDEGCWEANPTLDQAVCSDQRGNTFARNQSSSWSLQRLSNDGLYELDTYEENYLGLDGNAYYGFDTVQLGPNGSTLPVLANQLIAGIATNAFWLGSFPLSPLTFNIGSLTNPLPSLLSSMVNSSMVPSASWGYTAGAHYQSPPAYGSVTFGGYDASRFDDNRILRDVLFGPDLSRDLVVELQSIIYDTHGAPPLLSDSIYIFIDSMVTQLWLPTSVCQGFEKAFNLTWNSTNDLYLIDNQVHDALVALNPSFTFTLGSTGPINQTVDIILPYSAFDLNVTAPIISGESRYFPLKQAENSSQYTLGRVFLQEAYVIADYDRSNFSVAQAVFPAASVPAQIEAIEPPWLIAEPETKRALSGGAIAGIAVGAVIGLVLIILSALVVVRKRRRDEAAAKVRSQQIRGFQQDYARPPVSELSPLNTRHEMDPTHNARTEIDGLERTKVELDSSQNCHRQEAVKGVTAAELVAPLNKPSR